MRRAAAQVLAIGTIAAVITGCGGGDKPAAGDKDGKSEPVAYVTPKGAIKDLSKVTCKEGDDGVWAGSATLTNGTEEKQTYVVSFSITSKKTNAVLGEAQKEVAVEPGKSKDVELDSIHRAKERDGKVDCVQRVTLKPEQR